MGFLYLKRLPLALVFVVILSRFDLINCCSSSDDDDSTTEAPDDSTTEAPDACEGGGMVNGKLML